MRTSLGLVAVGALSGCLLFHASDGGGGNDGSGGSGAQGGNTVTAPNATSTGGAGAGGSNPCDAGKLGDPDNCGVCGWECGPGASCDAGVCTVVSVTLGEAFQGLAVSDSTVAVQRGTFTEAATTGFSIWPKDFGDTTTPTSGPAFVDDPRGFVTWLGSPVQRFAYAYGNKAVPQLETFDAQGAGNTTVTFQSNSTELAGFLSGLAMNEGDAYVLVSSVDTLLSIEDLACLDAVPPSDCLVEPASGVAEAPPGMGDITLLGLDGSTTGAPPLRWSSDRGTSTCTYSVEPPTGADVLCIEDVPPVTDTPRRVIAEGATVFIADGSASDRRILFRAPNNNEGLVVMPVPDGRDVRLPADTDGELLFGVVDETELVALRVAFLASEVGTTLVGTIQVDAPIVAVDASDDRFVFFLTSDPGADKSALHRWRKPPPPPGP